MKHRHLAPWLLTLALASPGMAAEPPAGAGVAMPAGSIGAPHRQLARLAGDWQVTQSLWMQAGQAAQVNAGTAHFAMVLGGRHLRQDLRIDSHPAFQGLGYIGYDNTARRYDSSWMDLNFTGLLLLHGDYDPRHATYRFRGEMQDAQGHAVPTRQELQVLDGRHLVARYFEGAGADERLVVQLEYSRR